MGQAWPCLFMFPGELSNWRAREPGNVDKPQIPTVDIHSGVIEKEGEVPKKDPPLA